MLTRVFDAPRELVFEAWTRAEHFARWFGPNDFVMPECEIDARPGGVIRFRMGHEGEAYWHAGVFREVTVPERLVFTLRFVDEAGEPVPHPTLSDWPVEAEFITTVTFAERDGGTEMVLRQVIAPADAAERAVFDVERPLARQGWIESFERLDAVLAYDGDGSSDRRRRSKP